MPFQDAVFEIEGTRYTFRKLGAVDSYRLFKRCMSEIGKQISPQEIREMIVSDGSSNPLRLVRTLLSESADAETTAESALMVAQLVHLLLNLDEVFVEDVRRLMFQQVKFTNSQVPKPMTLLDAEGQATDDGLVLFEIVARCLTANFTSSFKRLASVFLRESPSS